MLGLNIYLHTHSGQTVGIIRSTGQNKSDLWQAERSKSVVDFYFDVEQLSVESQSP